MKTITHSVIITLALVLQTFSYAACNSSNGTKCTAKTAPKVKEPTATDLSSGTYNQKTYYYYKPTPSDCHEKLCVVQHVKGFIKNKDGIFMTATLYGRAVEVNFDNWLVDSADTDPKAAVTASTSHEGWYYYYDRPGPPTKDKKGHAYSLNFHTDLFCKSAVPDKVSLGDKPNLGTGMKTFNWALKVKVKDDGTFEKIQ